MAEAVAHREKNRPSAGRWLNRNVAEMALASFFSDFGHETATTILPMLLVSSGDVQVADIVTVLLKDPGPRIQRRTAPLVLKRPERGTSCANDKL